MAAVDDNADRGRLEFGSALRQFLARRDAAEEPLVPAELHRPPDEAERRRPGFWPRGRSSPSCRETRRPEPGGERA
jgi:hypothetical protein